MRDLILTGRATVGSVHEELALPLFDSLYNFAGWLVHNSNDAEKDLVQETYLKALRSFASFQLGTNFKGCIGCFES